MSPLERWLWGTAGAVVAAGTAVCWWRLEKALKQERARHQAEMAEIEAQIAADPAARRTDGFDRFGDS